MVPGPRPVGRERVAGGAGRLLGRLPHGVSPALMRARLGFTTRAGRGCRAAADLLRLLQADRVDYTRFFRTLGDTTAIDRRRIAVSRAARCSPMRRTRGVGRIATRRGSWRRDSVDPERSERMRRHKSQIRAAKLGRPGRDRCGRKGVSTVSSSRCAGCSLRHSTSIPAMERFAAIPRRSAGRSESAARPESVASSRAASAAARWRRFRCRRAGIFPGRVADPVLARNEDHPHRTDPRHLLRIVPCAAG